ncbi:hypothetical protein GQ607_015876 [Colletotrichum asianum]|uniref:Uncharacterized protein n=1 Tax=Colletotrichum asianum TaxID=702518 RepID=A0A8H3ZKH3_9PEZI|nr:hypothetical protein GQ607_015876 [Colletotrichum asianum]
MAICPMNDDDDDDTTLPYSTLGIAKNLTHHGSACLPACLPAWPGDGTRQDTSSAASSSLPGIRAPTDRSNSRSSPRSMVIKRAAWRTRKTNANTNASTSNSTSASASASAIATSRSDAVARYHVLLVMESIWASTAT